MRQRIQSISLELPTELANRLEAISRPEPQFPYSFFGSEIQGMVHGGVKVAAKPVGYQTDVLPSGNRRRCI
ncbi:MAG: hypothetical protein RM338_14035 [Nostoc sp. DedQUE12a]|nr:hypothetical protein [Nostoc sp. DedQUE12a]